MVQSDIRLEMLQELYNDLMETRFSISVGFEIDELHNVVKVYSEEEYHPGDQAYLSAAWHDFKTILKELKLLRYRTVYNLNQPPTYKIPEWEIAVEKQLL